ncbi:class I SAM-dependent methyltransferase [Streptomyces atroolivaceus]|uniref:Class I SAM-dependent methyltransferase n=1 Tax=Streptomyces atroolivaceus TaxID=66869 RepID=A0ABV9VJP1_STRAZ|nr:class I SAM-dependent methyltransferase [Streptomyces atroolivaceus]
MTGQRDRWAELTGGQAGEEYAQRFARLAESGHDMHGEAAFCAALLNPAARILDAGCGTGRIAVRLAELGHHCTGVDIDSSMLAVARRDAPAQEWLLGDLARLEDLGLKPGFDLALAAGNVIPLLAPGTESAVVRQLAAVLRPGGLLVTGFGLDAAHLPLPEPPVTLTEFDHWCAQAGLTLRQRYATWSGDPYDQGCGYAVSVHSRPPREPSPATASPGHAPE